MTIERRDRSPEIFSFGKAMDEARQAFIAKEVIMLTLPNHPRHGRIFAGNNFLYASASVTEIMEESGQDMIKLASLMMSSTSTSPKKIEWAFIDGSASWQEVSKNIVQRIMELEMPIQFPELILENERRDNLGEFEID